MQFKSDHPIDSEEYFLEFFEKFQSNIRVMELTNGKGIIGFLFDKTSKTLNEIVFAVQYQWSHENHGFVVFPFMPETDVPGFSLPSSNIFISRIPSTEWIDAFKAFFIGEEVEPEEVEFDGTDPVVETFNEVSEARSDALDRDIGYYENIGFTAPKSTVH